MGTNAAFAVRAVPWWDEKGNASQPQLIAAGLAEGCAMVTFFVQGKSKR